MITYNQNVIKEAKNHLKVFKEIKTFNIIFEKCQSEIRNIGGKTGSDAFDELRKII